MKILVSIPNSDTLSMFSSILVSIGLPTPLKATDGTFTLKTFNEKKFDIVFVDDSLSDVPALEIIQNMKDKKPDLFIVILCESPSEEEILKLGKAGVSAILLKPFNKGSVEKILNKSGWRPNNRSGKNKEPMKRTSEHQKTYGILKKHLDSEAPILIDFENSKDKYRAFLKQVSDKQIIFDRLTPTDGNDLAVKKKKFRVIVYDQGDSVEFFTEIIKHKVTNGKHVFAIPFPKSICYVERRVAGRVRMDFCDTRSIEFSFKGKTIDSGIIYDISPDSVGIEVPGYNLEKIMDSGDTLDSLKFDDGNGQNFDCKLSIKRVVYDKQRQTSLMGGCLIELSDDNTETLKSYVANLEQQRFTYLSQVAQNQ